MDRCRIGYCFIVLTLKSIAAMWLVTASGLDDRGTIPADGCAFLDASAKLRKAAVGLIVCPPAWNDSLGFHWTDFHEILFEHFFGNPSRNVRFH